jgi:hypothetical protein
MLLSFLIFLQAQRHEEFHVLLSPHYSQNPLKSIDIVAGPKDSAEKRSELRLKELVARDAYQAQLFHTYPPPVPIIPCILS